MNLEDFTNNIQEKIGKDEAGKIADDIANILSYGNSLQKNIESKDNEINKLKKDKDMLVEANANLLQKLPLGKEEPKEKEPEEVKHFDFKSVFDKNGFKR